ncbi:hypothetical protein G3567_00040 [Psychroflexus sp. YR1-1]|uniref:GIY-YIG domain-containing protein n=1 Tax=Psychroflexus aurantiacus TaxID=2709310 RepID=A0A6B3QX07_9FLAO|nr:hypothetical protein [Psychroflexus aurantiacus]
MNKHNSSPFNKFTSKYRPWVLTAVFERGSSQAEAEAVEKSIKRQKKQRLTD